MNDIGVYMLLVGLVCAFLILVSWRTLVRAKLLRKGDLVEGRIDAHYSKIVYRQYNHYTDYWLKYSYDCNETNYLRVEEVDSYTYNELKDGDRVKVRYLPGKPTTAQLEASAFMTLLKRYSGYYKSSPRNG